MAQKAALLEEDEPPGPARKQRKLLRRQKVTNISSRAKTRGIPRAIQLANEEYVLEAEPVSPPVSPTDDDSFRYQRWLRHNIPHGYTRRVQTVDTAKSVVDPGEGLKAYSVCHRMVKRKKEYVRDEIKSYTVKRSIWKRWSPSQIKLVNQKVDIDVTVYNNFVTLLRHPYNVTFVWNPHYKLGESGGWGDPHHRPGDSSCVCKFCKAFRIPYLKRVADAEKMRQKYGRIQKAGGPARDSMVRRPPTVDWLCRNPQGFTFVDKEPWETASKDVDRDNNTRATELMNNLRASQIDTDLLAQENIELHRESGELPVHHSDLQRYAQMDFVEKASEAPTDKPGEIPPEQLSKHADEAYVETQEPTSPSPEPPQKESEALRRMQVEDLFPTEGEPVSDSTSESVAPQKRAFLGSLLAGDRRAYTREQDGILEVLKIPRGKQVNRQQPQGVHSDQREVWTDARYREGPSNRVVIHPIAYSPSVWGEDTGEIHGPEPLANLLPAIVPERKSVLAVVPGRTKVVLDLNAPDVLDKLDEMVAEAGQLHGMYTLMRARARELQGKARTPQEVLKAIKKYGTRRRNRVRKPKEKPLVNSRPIQPVAHRDPPDNLKRVKRNFGHMIATSEYLQMKTVEERMALRFKEQREREEWAAWQLEQEVVCLRHRFGRSRLIRIPGRGYGPLSDLSMRRKEAARRNRVKVNRANAKKSKWYVDHRLQTVMHTLRDSQKWLAEYKRLDTLKEKGERLAARQAKRRQRLKTKLFKRKERRTARQQAAFRQRRFWNDVKQLGQTLLDFPLFKSLTGKRPLIKQRSLEDLSVPPIVGEETAPTYEAKYDEESDVFVVDSDNVVHISGKRDLKDVGNEIEQMQRVLFGYRPPKNRTQRYDVGVKSETA